MASSIGAPILIVLILLPGGASAQRPIEDWALPSDGDDIALAFERCQEGGDGLEPIAEGNRGAIVMLGPKTYVARSGLHLTRPLIVRGQGQFNTRISVVGATGLHIHDANNSENPRPGKSGSGTVIEDLTVHYAGEYEPQAHHGIDIDARCYLTRVRVLAFPGDGIHVTAGSRPPLHSNANVSQFTAVDSISNLGAGFYLEGIDANASVFQGCNAQSNLAPGFWDRSFLGNFYLGCHAAAGKRTRQWWSSQHGSVMPAESTVGVSDRGNPYAISCTGANARSTVMMYAESQNLVDIRPPSYALPIQGGAATPDSVRAVINSSYTGLTFPARSRFVSPDGRIVLEMTPYANEVFNITQDGRMGYAMRYEGDFWRLKHSRLDTRVLLALPDGPGAASPMVLMPHGWSKTPRRPE